MRKAFRYCIGAMAVCASFTAGAVEPELQWSSGVDFTTGKYSDTESTDILYIPASVKALFGDFEAKLTVPYIRIKGPGTVVGGGDVGVVARTRLPGGVTTEDGLGDVTLALTYTRLMQDNSLFVDFTGKVKLPTASSDKNLGTGKTDFTAQIDLTKALGDVTVFGMAGRRFMGSSQALPLRDGFIGSVGTAYKMSDLASIGVIYDYRESASFRQDAEGASELTGYIAWKLSKRVRLQTYGVLGLSKGSPDTGVGIQLSFRP